MRYRLVVTPCGETFNTSHSLISFHANGINQSRHSGPCCPSGSPPTSFYRAPTLSCLIHSSRTRPLHSSSSIKTRRFHSLVQPQSVSDLLHNATMILRSKTLAAGSALVAVACASQPGAIAPIPGPMRDLTWGQLNFIHTTDTHGWIGGHFQEYVLPNLFLGLQLTFQAPILCRLG